MILDLQPTRSFDDIVALVAQASRAGRTGGDWILGRGWHQERWGEPEGEVFDGVPSHHALSEVSPDNPVLLTHAVVMRRSPTRPP